MARQRALFESVATACTRLERAARDESGAPLYRVRDWAAWVLSGEPD